MFAQILTLKTGPGYCQTLKKVEINVCSDFDLAKLTHRVNSLRSVRFELRWAHGYKQGTFINTKKYTVIFTKYAWFCFTRNASGWWP